MHETFQLICSSHQDMKAVALVPGCGVVASESEEADGVGIKMNYK